MASWLESFQQFCVRYGAQKFCKTFPAAVFVLTKELSVEFSEIVRFALRTNPTVNFSGSFHRP